MGDNKKATLAMARKELEDLYAGVVDDSVNLTFQDLAQVTHQKIKQPPSSSSSQSPPLANMEAASSKSSPQNHNSNKPEKPIPAASPSLAKLPSLDFSKAFENSLQNHHQHYHMMSEAGGHHQIPQGHHDHHHLQQQQHHHHHVNEHLNHHHYKNQGISSYDAHDHHHGGFAGSNSRHHHMDDHNRSFVYDGDVSQYMSGMSMSMGQETRSGCGTRRPGIPHSNICAVCCNYTYLFRHRCLVCGRVYCRQCVRIGMGDMSQGRKCIECLGRRFSQRYIHKAGNIGCCMGYPSSVKQQELIWAEKGPRRTADQNGRFGHGHSVMGSRPRTPTTPRSEHHSAMNSPSFVVGSPYSHTSRHHHLPF